MGAAWPMDCAAIPGVPCYGVASSVAKSLARMSEIRKLP
jgi:hypothetical protein